MKGTTRLEEKEIAHSGHCKYFESIFYELQERPTRYAEDDMNNRNENKYEKLGFVVLYDNRQNRKKKGNMGR